MDKKIEYYNFFHSFVVLYDCEREIETEREIDDIITLSRIK